MEKSVTSVQINSCRCDRANICSRKAKKCNHGEKKCKKIENIANLILKFYHSHIIALSNEGMSQRKIAHKIMAKEGCYRANTAERFIQDTGPYCAKPRSERLRANTSTVAAPGLGLWGGI